MKFNNCIFGLCLSLLSQLTNCQEVQRPVVTTKTIINQGRTAPITNKSGSIYRTTILNNNRIVTTPINRVPSYTTNGFFTTSSSLATSITNGNENLSGAEPGLNNTSRLNSTIYEKPINWTSGFGTHYGPFPSNPHFSEVGYQPNDVGVGCSDGRPGGDPHWQKILSKGVYPSPNIVNHEKTVWPVAYTVAVSLAVWNKEDVCWKTLKIRNKKKPQFVIEAYIVDFCPIGHCLWEDDYLPRNVDIYGEKAWLALGADVNESNLDVEIEWPKGLFLMMPLN